MSFDYNEFQRMINKAEMEMNVFKFRWDLSADCIHRYSNGVSATKIYKSLVEAEDKMIETTKSYDSRFLKVIQDLKDHWRNLAMDELVRRL